MMRKALFRMTVLDEEYVEVRDLRAKLWSGTLIYFPVSPEFDVKCYMMVFNDAAGQFDLINWIGYKAGLKLVLASVPETALCKGEISVRLSWFKENWDSVFLPFGSFETTKFLQWTRRTRPMDFGSGL